MISYFFPSFRKTFNSSRVKGAHLRTTKLFAISENQNTISNNYHYSSSSRTFAPVRTIEKSQRLIIPLFCETRQFCSEFHYNAATSKTQRERNLNDPRRARFVQVIVCPLNVVKFANCQFARCMRHLSAQVIIKHTSFFKYLPKRCQEN